MVYGDNGRSNRTLFPSPATQILISPSVRSGDVVRQRWPDRGQIHKAIQFSPIRSAYAHVLLASYKTNHLPTQFSGLATASSVGKRFQASGRFRRANQPQALSLLHGAPLIYSCPLSQPSRLPKMGSFRQFANIYQINTTPPY
jgi:hypothetical protein